jgi:hypothetical protein
MCSNHGDRVGYHWHEHGYLDARAHLHLRRTLRGHGNRRCHLSLRATTLAEYIVGSASDPQPSVWGMSSESYLGAIGCSSLLLRRALIQLLLSFTL